MTRAVVSGLVGWDVHNSRDHISVDGVYDLISPFSAPRRGWLGALGRMILPPVTFSCPGPVNSGIHRTIRVTQRQAPTSPPVDFFHPRPRLVPGPHDTSRLSSITVYSLPLPLPLLPPLVANTHFPSFFLFHLQHPIFLRSSLHLTSPFPTISLPSRSPWDGYRTSNPALLINTWGSLTRTPAHTTPTTQSRPRPARSLV